MTPARLLLMSPSDPDYPADFDAEAAAQAEEDAAILRADSRRETY